MLCGILFCAYHALISHGLYVALTARVLASKQHAATMGPAAPAVAPLDVCAVASAKSGSATDFHESHASQLCLLTSGPVAYFSASNLLFAGSFRLGWS
jgi:hypothetical protein